MSSTYGRGTRTRSPTSAPSASKARPRGVVRRAPRSLRPGLRRRSRLGLRPHQPRAREVRARRPGRAPRDAGGRQALQGVAYGGARDVPRGVRRPSRRAADRPGGVPGRRGLELLPVPRLHVEDGIVEPRSAARAAFDPQDARRARHRPPRPAPRPVGCSRRELPRALRGLRRPGGVRAHARDAARTRGAGLRRGSSRRQGTHHGHLAHRPSRSRDLDADGRGGRGRSHPAGRQGRIGGEGRRARHVGRAGVPVQGQGEGGRSEPGVAATAVLEFADKVWTISWTTFGDDALVKADQAAFETLLHGMQLAIR